MSQARRVISRAHACAFSHGMMAVSGSVRARRVARPCSSRHSRRSRPYSDQQLGAFETLWPEALLERFNDLAADFAALKLGRMYVGIGRPGADRCEELGKFARGDALRSGAVADVHSLDRSSEGCLVRRTELRAGGAVTQVRAQEHHDATV